MIAIASKLYDCSISMLTESKESSEAGTVMKKLTSVEMNELDSTKPRIFIGFMASCNGMESKNFVNEIPRTVNDYYVSLLPIPISETASNVVSDSRAEPKRSGIIYCFKSYYFFACGDRPFPVYASI